MTSNALSRAVTRRPIPETEPPSIADALTHVVDVGEQLVSHRLELVVVELRKTIEGIQQAAQLMLVALLLAGSGWVFAMLALFTWLFERFGSRALAAAAVGLLQLALAAILVMMRRRPRST